MVVDMWLVGVDMYCMDWHRKCGTESKVHGDFVVSDIGYDIKAGSFEEGLEWTCSWVPSETIRQECASLIAQDAVTARMIDKIPFVVVNARFAGRARITAFFASLAVVASTNDSHQCCMRTLLASETLLASSWCAAMCPFHASRCETICLYVHLISDPSEAI
jgi:hypothetical protein